MNRHPRPDQGFQRELRPCPSNCGPIREDDVHWTEWTCPCGNGYYDSNGNWVSGYKVRHGLALPREHLRSLEPPCEDCVNPRDVPPYQGGQQAMGYPVHSHDQHQATLSPGAQTQHQGYPRYQSTDTSTREYRPFSSNPGYAHRQTSAAESTTDSHASYSAVVPPIQGRQQAIGHPVHSHDQHQATLSAGAQRQYQGYPRYSSTDTSTREYRSFSSNPGYAHRQSSAVESSTDSRASYSAVESTTDSQTSYSSFSESPAIYEGYPQSMYLGDTAQDSRSMQSPLPLEEEDEPTRHRQEHAPSRNSRRDDERSLGHQPRRTDPRTRYR